MRLTLRTLLAYLDDMLPAAEAQDLGARIQENEFATNLVHRIREAMRREKLGAPRLQGKAAGLDPNTVIEVGLYAHRGKQEDREGAHESCHFQGGRSTVEAGDHPVSCNEPDERCQREDYFGG